MSGATTVGLVATSTGPETFGLSSEPWRRSAAQEELGNRIDRRTGGALRENGRWKERYGLAQLDHGACGIRSELGNDLVRGEPRATHRRPTRHYKNRVRMLSKLDPHVAVVSVRTTNCIERLHEDSSAPETTPARRVALAVVEAASSVPVGSKDCSLARNACSMTSASSGVRVFLAGSFRCAHAAASSAVAMAASSISNCSRRTAEASGWSSSFGAGGCLRPREPFA